jgi:hypothetical protein
MKAKLEICRAAFVLGNIVEPDAIIFGNTCLQMNLRRIIYKGAAA